MVLGPSMTYTCAVLPDRGRHPRGGAVREVRPGLPQARPAAGHAAARRRLRLGRHGPARREALRRRGRRRDAVARAGRVGAGRDQARGARRRGRGAASATTATCATPASTRSARSGSPSTSASATTRRTSRSCATSWCPGGRLLNHCITRPDNSRHRHRRVHRPLRVPRRRADRVGPDHHRDPGRSASRCGTRRTSASTTR